jgi:hypothetical protein
MISLDNKNSGTNSSVFCLIRIRYWNVCGTFVETFVPLLFWLQVLRSGHTSRKKQQNILLQPIAEVAHAAG